jgi:hypothetical protein
MAGMMGRGIGKVNMHGRTRATRQAGGDDGPTPSLTWMARHSDASGLANINDKREPKENKLGRASTIFATPQFHHVLTTGKEVQDG